MRIRESFAAAGVLVTLAACSSQVKAVEAEATYLGQQLRCVDGAPNRAEEHKCRDAVDEAWGIHHTVKDGGAE